MSSEPGLRPRPDPFLGVQVGVDPAGQLAFVGRFVLGADQGFVAEGGAKCKLVCGDTGAGKTHFLGAVVAQGEADGYLTAYIDARTRPLWGFDALYRAATAELDFEDLVRRFLARTLDAAGYRGFALGPGQSLAAWAAANDHEAGPLRVRLDEILHRQLLRNPDIDFGYGTGLVRYCEHLAGTAVADADGDGALLIHWLRGGHIAVRACNRLRIRHSADRFTARLWLRSLLHFARFAGLPGLVVAIDNLDVVTEVRRRVRGGEPSPAADAVHYTKQRRDDLFETLRALIDDMGMMPGLLLVLAGPPALVDSRSVGFASYPALLERISTEVVAPTWNRFADDIRLERLWASDDQAREQLAAGVLAAAAPQASAELRAQVQVAARAQWQARDPSASPVRRTVAAVLKLAQTHSPSHNGGA